MTLLCAILLAAAVQLASAFDDEAKFFPVRLEGELCSNYEPCVPPYVCDVSYSALGAVGVGRCRLPATAGSACQTKSASSCKSPLTCDKGVCRAQIPVGSVCNDAATSICAPPLQCRGEGIKRCELPLTVGQRCDGERRFCGTGMTCVEYGGARRCMRTLSEGGTCGNAVDMCPSGTMCVKRGGKTSCQKAGGKGAKCKLPDNVCMRGNACVKGSCLAVVGPYASCGDGTTICMDGLECKGAGSTKRCVRSFNTCSSKSGLTGAAVTVVTAKPIVKSAAKPVPKPEAVAATSSAPLAPKLPGRGELCNAREKGCAAGHVCLGIGNKSKCFLVQKEYGTCTGDHVMCKKGWDCRGPPTSRICIQTVDLGKGCDEAYFFCKPSMQCISWGKQRRCVKFIGLNGKCDHTFELCDAGLTCKASPGSTGKRCVVSKPPLPDAQLPGTDTKCKQPEGWCKSTHVCVGPSELKKCLGFARAGRSCEGKNNVCASNSSCRGEKGNRKCKGSMSKGKGCDNKTFICQEGLTCMLWGSGMRCVSFLKHMDNCAVSHAICGPGTSCVRDGPNGARSCHTKASAAKIKK